MSFISALLQHHFLQHAVIGSVLASIACGLMGPFIVVRKESYIAGGISHSILSGMGIAYFLGQQPFYGAAIAALIVALIIGWINLTTEHSDTAISILWAFGMAIGIIFIAKTPGYYTDLVSYLFGNILMISHQDLYLIGILDIFIIVLLLLFFKIFVAISFDSEFARLRGVAVNTYYLLLLCITALTVVVLVQVVGLVLVIALLVLPTSMALNCAKFLPKVMLWAMLICCFQSLVGLWFSYELDLPSGAVIILFAVLCFVLQKIVMFAARKIALKMKIN